MGKKTREPSPSSSESAVEDTKMASPSASPDPSKKRKRSSKSDKAAADEIEIDVSAPEPLSKAEARKAKKAKTKPTTTKSSEGGVEGAEAETPAANKAENGGRTVFGIWIGNLPFTADKTVVRVFFTRQGQIPDDQITRVHMPVPAHAQPGRAKPNNKGFAYIDFSTKDAHEKAIALSESLMTGRKVLIKDAKSFEGRPANATATANALNGVTEGGEEVVVDEKTGKSVVKPVNPSSKRVFVGNLTFDVTKEDLEAHFVQAGEIEDIHMATFEDSGKCKGYGWIRFVEIEAAEAAVKGFVFKEEPASDDEEEEEEVEEEDSSSSADSDSEAEAKPKKSKKAKKSKKPKKRKWFINRLQGRTLRCEFAEDSQTRYKKRFGKDRPRDGEESAGAGAPIADADGDAGGFKPKFKPRGTADERQEQRRRKHEGARKRDARNIAPGAALANAPRASGAIVAAAGKKTTFE